MIKITYQVQKNMFLHWNKEVHFSFFPYSFFSQNHILPLLLFTVKDFIKFIIIHYLFKFLS